MKKQNILIALLSTTLLVPSFIVPASAASISASKAKSIVLADAKVKESALHDYEVEKDTYKGKAVYSIEFESKGVEWEYEVQRSNGKILKKEVEGKVSNDQCISVTKAKKIVFADANVKEADVRDFEIERNVYKTVNSYSIEFEVKGIEYEYEVSRKSGKILYKEVEGKKVNASISKSKAKSIVLKDAGVSSSAVKDYDVELDNEKGVAVYEIDFEVKNVEYEYKVNATTGKIIKKSVDRD